MYHFICVHFKFIVFFFLESIYSRVGSERDMVGLGSSPRTASNLWTLRRVFNNTFLVLWKTQAFIVIPGFLANNYFLRLLTLWHYGFFGKAFALPQMLEMAALSWVTKLKNRLPVSQRPVESFKTILWSILKELQKAFNKVTYWLIDWCQALMFGSVWETECVEWSNDMMEITGPYFH